MNLHLAYLLVFLSACATVASFVAARVTWDAPPLRYLLLAFGAASLASLIGLVLA